MHGEPEIFDACPEGFSVSAMSCPGLIETFFSQKSQCFPHPEIHIHRRGVVINPIATPVLVQQGNVEVPIRHLASAGLHLGLSAGSHGERAEAGGAAQAFLTTAVRQINFPIVDVKRHAAE